MGKLRDLSGQKFGRFTVTDKHESRGVGKKSKVYWFCKCECGTEKWVIGASLTSGNTKSCGCYHSDNLVKRNKSHGMSKTSVYRIWSGIIGRTCNPDDNSYSRYGGRGISVCERWKDFENFYEDMGDRPEGKSIDRIDNDGDYCPENCRWATDKQQTNNSSRNFLITRNGETKTLAEWCGGIDGDYNGIPYSVIYYRIKDYGWSIERAFKEPVRTWD